MFDQRSEFDDKLRRLTNRAIRMNSMGLELGTPQTECEQSLLAVTQPLIPGTLYKLSGSDNRDNFTRTLKDIENNRLHMSSPSAFNDPFDCQPYWNYDKIRYRLSKSLNKENLAETITFHRKQIPPKDVAAFDAAMNHLQDNFSEMKQAYTNEVMQQLQPRYDKIRKAYRCASLTEERSSGPMWANYADNGRGFMVSYAAKGMDINCRYESRNSLSGGEPFGFILPVVYTGRYDLSDLSSVIADSEQWYSYQTEMALLTFISSVTYKTPHWSYEREWRVVCSDCPESAQVYVYLQATGMYIGYATPKDKKDKLVECARKLHLPIYQGEVDLNSRKGEINFVRLG